MSPFGFHHKDRLAQPPLADPVPGKVLVLKGDTGYSTMNWWSARVLLRLTLPGQDPTFLTHECTVIREKAPLTGMVLPVEVERSDPKVVRISWEQVPSIDERIASRDPFIFDPDSAWQAVLEADPRQADRQPAWGDGSVPGWPSIEELRHGRRPATALVVAHAGDPEGCFSAGNFVPPDRSSYSSGGSIGTMPHKFPGWLLLCVIPPQGERFGLFIETEIMREHLAPVLPVTLDDDPSQAADVEIAWDSAPEVVTALAARKAAEAELIQQAAAQAQPGSSEEAAASLENPWARKLAARMAKKGAVIVVTHGEDDDAPPPG